MNERTKLNFPRIVSIQLEHFSLYSLQPTVRIELPDGVFCLTGANGLGKSTFLAAMNFGITGVVLDPSKTFETARKLYRGSPDFSRSFFDGRISEEDRDRAAVSITLQTNRKIYNIQRPLFTPRKLTHLEIFDDLQQKLIVDGVDLPEEARIEEYETQLAQDIGVNSFEQYVFLQLYVLTFDESRHLLFWDDKALDEAISYCIGADFEKAHQMSIATPIVKTTNRQQ